MAFDVAYQLEQAGYTVTDKPARGYTRKDKQSSLRRNLTGQNWTA